MFLLFMKIAFHCQWLLRKRLLHFGEVLIVLKIGTGHFYSDGIKMNLFFLARLATLARKYLSIPAFFVPSEGCLASVEI